MSQHITSLAVFLKTGELGGLCLSLTRGEVEQLLGAPPEWLNDRKVWSKSAIWKYGSLQVTFSPEEEVIGFGLYAEAALKLPDGIVFDGYRPTRNTTFEDFQNYLTENHFTFSEDTSYAFGGRRLIVESHMHVYFTDNNYFYAIRRSIYTL